MAFMVTDTVSEDDRAQRIWLRRAVDSSARTWHSATPRATESIEYRRPRTLIEVQSAIRSVDIEGLVAADESEFLGALGYAVDFAVLAASRQGGHPLRHRRGRPRCSRLSQNRYPGIRPARGGTTRSTRSSSA